MADTALRQTDRKLAEMERHLAGIYERANREVGEKWKAYMERAAEKIKPYEAAYEAAKKAGDAEAIKKAQEALVQKQKSVTILDKHYRAMTTQLAAELSNVNKTAAAYINGQLPEIYAINHNGVGARIEKAVAGYSFELVDASTVKSLATQNKALLPRPAINIAKDMRWNKQVINAEVLQGIIQGERVDKIAKRIFPEIMSKTDLTGKSAAEIKSIIKKNKEAAIRNARTATTGAQNRGRMDMLRSAKDKGIKVKKVWLAASDNRTRDAHAELDGTEADIDEPFINEFGEIMFPGDPSADPANVYNCRCTLTYKVVGFE